MKVGQGPSALQAQLEAQQKDTDRRTVAGAEEARNRRTGPAEPPAIAAERRLPVAQDQSTLNKSRGQQRLGANVSSAEDIDRAKKRVANLAHREAPIGRTSAQEKAVPPPRLGQIVDILV